VPKASTLENDIAALPELSLGELRARWTVLTGQPAPKSFRTKFLARAVAYQMQCKAFGGLPEATKARLREIAAAASDGTFDAATAGPRIKPGTKLVRTWHGETHNVLVLENGFSWKGEHHSSLSAIAKAITGTSWNGWSFFGLKQTEQRRGRGVAGSSARTSARRRVRLLPQDRTIAGAPALEAAHG
jgi:hypothetical protein